MDLGDWGEFDLVDLVMALEEAIPGLKFADTVTAEDVVGVLRDRLGDDPDGRIAEVVRRKGRSGRDGADAEPQDGE